VARRAGHVVAVRRRVYAHCIDGQANAANQWITDAIGTEAARATAFSVATAGGSVAVDAADRGPRLGEDAEGIAGGLHGRVGEVGVQLDLVDCRDQGGGVHQPLDVVGVKLDTPIARALPACAQGTTRGTDPQRANQSAMRQAQWRAFT
jgi:hypothetical protein